MSYPFAIVDVFTRHAYRGNPLGVVFDARGLSTAQMQAITREFNYSESTFILPPASPDNHAQVRIFTPDREIPFAGHPNVGTAVALAARHAAQGLAVPAEWRFEEGAGLVRVALAEDGQSAHVEAPLPLSRASQAPAEAVARALNLAPADILQSEHAPQVVSVGLPFVVVQLASRDALRRAAPDRDGYAALLPLDGAYSIYAYTREADPGTDVQARMFTSRMTEDPATGSATAAMAGLRAALAGDAVSLTVGQGVDMGRASLLQARARPGADGVRASVGGGAVIVMQGTLTAPPDAA